ncbi:MAG: hypothetical protein UT02_C0002G0029 [Parcubacteria group bacterium GW2011_GWC2_38_7]|nr:MAG: hypothetical protein UT02_C0002G0029 [Parcubacteria group bacterium GW2011_GWC2_38_7]
MDTLKPERTTLEEIKKILIKHCSDIDRDLVIWKAQKDKNANCYFFALAGTPPKGYGIYSFSSGKRFLCLYDINGKRFKNYHLESGINFD